MISIAFLGRGGQGIVFAASILAEAFFKKGYYVVQLQSYGAEVRGGSVLAYIIADEKAVENPFIEGFDVAVVLHEAGAKRWRKLLENTKLVIVDSDLVKTRVGGKVVETPIARKLSPSSLTGRENIAGLGLIMGLRLLDIDEEAVLSILQSRKEWEENIKAYRLGVNLGVELKHVLGEVK